MGKQIEQNQEQGREKAVKTLLQFAGYIKKLHSKGKRDVFMTSMPADAAQALADAIFWLYEESNSYSPQACPEFTPLSRIEEENEHEDQTSI